VTDLRTERRPNAVAGVARFATDWELGRTGGTATSPLRTPVYLVVGFDGTEPAQRALDSAARLLRDHDGGLEVVYVAHLPATAAMSPDAMVEVSNGFDETERFLYDESRSRLESIEPRWHFQRRQGAVGHELIAVADELRQRHGPQARIALVVGGSAHKYHRVIGSVSSNLERADRFPVVVVP
jgi:nucleotide-binding universal stress UspA family protein